MKDRFRVLSAVTVGHLAATVMIGFAVPWVVQMRTAMDGALWQWGAAAGLLGMAVHHWRGHAARPACGFAGQAGLAIWSFVVGTAHGAGLMLVPALAPLCAGDAAIATATLLPALGMMAVHTAAMLLVMAAVAHVAARAIDANSQHAISPSPAPSLSCLSNDGGSNDRMGSQGRSRQPGAAEQQALSHL